MGQLKHIKNISAYNDLKPISAESFTGKLYRSRQFERDFVEDLKLNKSSLGLRTKNIDVLDKLMDKDILILVISKMSFLDMFESQFAAAYYHPVLDHILVDTKLFYRSKSLFSPQYMNFKRAIGTIWHELGHYAYTHKPFHVIKHFLDMFKTFYQLSLEGVIHYKTGIKTDVFRPTLMYIVDNFFITADSGLTLFVFENNFIRYLDNETTLPTKVKKVILNYCRALSTFYRTGSASPVSAYIKVLRAVHYEMANIPKNERHLYSSGVPLQEVVIPSEILCIQSELNPLVRNHLMEFVGTKLI